MDESGEVYFAGEVKTSKNAQIGTSLSVGTGANAIINFMGPVNAEGSISVVDHEMNIKADYVRINGKDILAEIDKLWAAIAK